MWTFLSIFIVLTSIVFIPFINVGDMFWIPKEALFVVLGFSLLGVRLIDNTAKTLTFKNKWIGLILIYTIISFGWFFYKPLIFSNADKKILWNLWAIRPAINFILGVLLIQTLVEYTDNLRRWVNVAKVLCWVAFGFSVYAILQYCGLDQIFNKAHWVEGRWALKHARTITFFGQHTLTASFIASISPLCLIFKELRFKIIYSTIFIALILCNSAVSLCAFSAGLFIYLVMVKNYKGLILISLLVLLAIRLNSINHTDFFAFNGRLALWKETLVSCKDSVLTGSGIGSFALNKFTSTPFGRHALSAHSEPIQILKEGGLFLAVLVGGYLLGLFKRIFFTQDTILKIGYTCALCAFLAGSLGISSLRIAPLALLGILYISALEAQI